MKDTREALGPSGECGGSVGRAHQDEGPWKATGNQEGQSIVL